MDAHQTHSNLPSPSGELSCSEASGSSSGQRCREEANVNKHNLGEGSGGPVAGNSRSSQTQADTLVISGASQLPVTKKPRKMVYESSTSSDGNLTINALPDELLLIILSYMRFWHLLYVIPRVCSRWKTLSEDAELWRDRVYEVRRDSTDWETLLVLEMMPQLRTLILQRPVDVSVFHALCTNCPEVTTLDIHEGQSLSKSGVKNFVNIFTNIHTLKISADMYVRGILVEDVLKMSHLRVLHLKGNVFNVSETWLSALADKCPQLCDLDLVGVDYNIQDMEYFINTKRHTLKRICLRWKSDSGRFVAPLLAVCAATLEHLVLRRCDTWAVGSDEAYAALGKLHNLKVLSFEKLEGDAGGALSLLFKSGRVSSLKNLQFVRCQCRMNEIITAVSRGCPALRELSLKNCAWLTDADFVDIHHLEQLEMLISYDCGWLNGAAIPYISTLPALHTLCFSGVRFESFHLSVEHILDMSGLRCLYFRNCVTQSVPFDRFPGRLVNLRELHLVDCNEERYVLIEMCNQMPELQVHHQYHIWDRH